MTHEKKHVEEVHVTPVHPHHASGIAIGSLIAGIAAFLFGWLPVIGFLAGVIAIVFGIIAIKNPADKGLSIAGIITGSFGVLWSILSTIFLILGFTILTIGGLAFSEGMHNLDSRNYADNADILDAQADTNRDFKKGETAKFGRFEVTVNSVQRNYIPENSYPAPGEGNEFVLVNVTAKNTWYKEKSINTDDFILGHSNSFASPSLFSVDPAFDGGDLSANETATGNILFEVPKDTTDLKLRYTLYVPQGIDTIEESKLVYTLAI